MHLQQLQILVTVLVPFIFQLVSGEYALDKNIKLVNMVANTYSPCILKVG